VPNQYDNPATTLTDAVANKSLSSARVREIRRPSDIVVPGIHPVSKAKGHWYVHTESVQYVVSHEVEEFFSKVSGMPYPTCPANVVTVTDAGGTKQPGFDLRPLDTSSGTVMSISDIASSGRFALLRDADMPSSWRMMGCTIAPYNSELGIYRRSRLYQAHSAIVEDPSSIQAVWIPAAANISQTGITSDDT
jgi:hypothetical protein